ncbi:MAG: helix-turn-helix transcriptional regulator [Nitrospiraceae bacterium]|nr:helix-turn-helix transcriptional regulator [Nitrospiraceae bacterium]
MKSDKAMGELIRQLRKSAGMSQMKLAEKIGVSYQQVQKYEKGVNRLSVSRLEQISDALGVSANLFLGEGDALKAADSKGAYKGLSNDEGKLLMLYRRLQGKKIKTGFLEMLDDVVKLAERKR